MSTGSFDRLEVAARYATAPLFAAGDDLALIREAAALTGRERLLDLGTAAGHTALALAPAAAYVLGIDPSPAMLREARRLAAERAISNLGVAVAVADPLPCGDGALDLITCRYAAHHFPDLPGALYEIARVLRPGGRLLVTDTVSPEASELASFINEIELLRDPSHAYNYRLSQWEDALAKAGLRYELLSRWYLPQYFDTWVERVGTPAANVATLEARFDAAPAAAIEAFQIVGEPRRAFSLHAALFVATKG